MEPTNTQSIKTGTKSEKILPTTDKTFSIVDTIGFPIPAVVLVEPSRTKPVPAWIIPAMPPPAMMAKVHFSKGVNSTKAEAETNIPAATEHGAANTSNALSITGM